MNIPANEEKFSPAVVMPTIWGAVAGIVCAVVLLFAVGFAVYSTADPNGCVPAASVAMIAASSVVAGFVGAKKGGGMMMLLLLTGVLGYELKTAVGTSVFIMAFTAFTGAVSHFVIGGMPDLLTLVFCVASTLLWARIAARFANKASALTLNRAVGVVLVVLGAAIMIVKFI